VESQAQGAVKSNMDDFDMRSGVRRGFRARRSCGDIYISMAAGGNRGRRRPDVSFAREVSRGHDTKMEAAATELDRQGNRASGFEYGGKLGAAGTTSLSRAQWAALSRGFSLNVSH